MYNSSKSGQSLVEYGIFVILITVIGFITLQTFNNSSKMTDKLGNIKNKVHQNASMTTKDINSPAYTLAPSTNSVTPGACYYKGQEVPCSDCPLPKYQNACTGS